MYLVTFALFSLNDENEVSEQDSIGFAVMTATASVNLVSIKRQALPRGTITVT